MLWDKLRTWEKNVAKTTATVILATSGYVVEDYFKDKWNAHAHAELAEFKENTRQSISFLMNYIANEPKAGARSQEYGPTFVQLPNVTAKEVSKQLEKR